MLSVTSLLDGKSYSLWRRNLPIPPASCSSLREVVEPPTDAQLRQETRRKTPLFPPIGTAKRVVLVRHGQSTWNEEGRIQGSSNNSVLTVKGESQAETSRQMLLGDSFDVCFTSPLIRSKRTAEIIWGSRKGEIIIEPELREIDLYSFQGLLKHEGKERFGNAYRQWQKDAENFIIDGHYPVRELWNRADSCWNKILAHEGKSVLVVAHNAVNQALVATAIGLGTKYFRNLLQSNCGVSVLDFIPKNGDGSPHIFLNRLNQTPNSPVSLGSSGGRKTDLRIILVCHGATQSTESQKTAELLLDLKVNCIICSPRIASVDTATAISEVQAAADCLGVDCIPRDVEMKKMLELEVEPIIYRARKVPRNPFDFQLGLSNELDESSLVKLWNQSRIAWQSLLQELSNGSGEGRNVVVVAHPAIHVAFMAHCLGLTKEWMDSFHVDLGSISVLDFPDGAGGRGVVRCANYTAHLGRWSIPVTNTQANDEEF
ncbi:hypothetical protein HPP92_008818 [Vanilla planifolia]|uniref:2-carboxy-D-arabinitol-1-phosphatase n=1 Tax=Vanilla planifolia TaxID=51239 RepID=A0A835RI27_VANPL|nr:hypothetical protein HPP92_008818 [Vanilla planifolia]